jgi:hypothetical protein
MARLKMGNKELERALANLSTAHNEARKWRTKISTHSVAKYGYDPADIDNDEFLDACDGLCGECDGMTAEEFDKSMRDNLPK